jgi:hypothetical protein
MRHSIQNAHAGIHGEYMAPRRSRLQRAIWTAGTTYKEKNKSKGKSKNAAKKKHSRREDSLAYANGIDCARGSQKPEKQKQFIA